MLINSVTSNIYLFTWFQAIQTFNNNITTTVNSYTKHKGLNNDNVTSTLMFGVSCHKLLNINCTWEKGKKKEINVTANLITLKLIFILKSFLFLFVK